MSILYFDGGAVPNPGKMHVCITLDGVSHYQNLDDGTNNEAEWMALLWGLSFAVAEGVTEIEVIGDSKLIINQALDIWKINNEKFLPMKEEYDRLKKRFKKIDLKFVRRNQNLAGHHIEKMLSKR